MSQPDFLYAMRHSTAHLLAAAVTELYPEVKLGVGPVVENGFFYDLVTSQPLTENDLSTIEAKMREIQKRDDVFRREEMSLEDATVFFEKQHQPFKVELLRDLKERGTTKIRPEEMQDLGEKSDTASVYYTGNFVDLCRGPHIEHTSQIGAFKLTKLAGAYWRGDEKNPQLQRIYGLTFETQEALDAHLLMLEEAKKRDHKKLGPELDLFTFSELVGSGLPLWTPRGTVVRNLLDQFVWKMREACGYVRVEIPHITKKDLYERSGHWEKFKDELFKIETREGHVFAMKPMNCPHHTQIYARKPWSYRDLPQRYANSTMCYRDEQSGELAGLSRVRAFTQDDAHVFCRLSQAKEEFLKIWDIVHTFYGMFGFSLRVRISRHDPSQPEKYLGDADRWAFAENMLSEIAKEKHADSFDGLGEAAFYGPKLDFMAKDAIGRAWRVATIQLDMNMPERFDLTCINEKGEKERIVMIHAAIMGSIERFLSILIEHLAGQFPLWLAPVQVRFITVSQETITFAKTFLETCTSIGIRAELDDSDEKVGKKIRDAAMMKIPWTVVVGAKEAEGNPFHVRVFGQEEELILSKEELFDRLQKEGKMSV
jgi:threonyl-tRNA synthetase